MKTALCLVFVALTAACGPAPRPGASVATPPQTPTLTNGDVLAVVVWGRPDLFAEVTVTQDTLRLPILGRVAVHGHTVTTLRRTLVDAFSTVIPNADVAVMVKPRPR